MAPVSGSRSSRARARDGRLRARFLPRGSAGRATDRRDCRCRRTAGASVPWPTTRRRPAPRVLVVETRRRSPQGLGVQPRAQGLRGRPWRATGDGALERTAPGRTTSSFSTSACRKSTASRSASGCGAPRNFTPILMLTARAQPDDVIFGLKPGADDYVAKPFDLAELLARVEGLLRRQAWSRQTDNGSQAEGQRQSFGHFCASISTPSRRARRTAERSSLRRRSP